MTTSGPAASFDSGGERVAAAPNGGLARREAIDHARRFERRVHHVRDGVWSVVEGPDALVGCGLGPAFRLPEHAPFTHGHLPPTHTFDEPVRIELAGLAVELAPAPSDADDSITIWFPELSVAVHNLLWPALFNVFAIRGEEYRDPRILLTGFDHLLGLDAEHLVATHGPPLSGADRVRTELTRSRDAIQYLWDQTVRGVNLGLPHGELIEFVLLPEFDDASYLQTQFYGLAEHHVRQIHVGLRGWFDDDTTVRPHPHLERNPIERPGASRVARSEPRPRD